MAVFTHIYNCNKHNILSKNTIHKQLQKLTKCQFLEFGISFEI